MWQSLGKFVIRYRIVLLILLALATGLMGYYASKVRLSYDFARAIPTDNPKYQEYLAFRQMFGDDGNLLVVGIQPGLLQNDKAGDSLFLLNNFKAYQQLQTRLKSVPAVEDVLGVPGAVSLGKDSLSEKLAAKTIFPSEINSQESLDSARTVFRSLPFYETILSNRETHAYLMGVRINRDQLNSPARTQIVSDIENATGEFSKKTGIAVHLSGLPLIRTSLANRIQEEMKLFLFGSLALSVLILLLFFRSISTTLLSLAVVITGVIWTLGTLYLFGYNITLLTALMPSLVVVIGIPNCIYFINKFHSSYVESGDKKVSLINMVSKMGIVTLFCNLTAAIGFAVFALTRSTILKEFGVVAGISIMIIFFVSFILLPAVLSLLPAPAPAQLKYLRNKWITRILSTIEHWIFNRRRWIVAATVIVVLFSVAGIMRLKSVAFIVDDLPKDDRIYTDLKFFERNFKGVMPLEILIDTKKPNGLRRPGVFERIDSLSGFIATLPATNRPLSMSEAFRFFYQGFSEGDSSTYIFPNEKFVEELVRKLKPASKSTAGATNKDSTGNALTKMMGAFMDSSRQRTRLSIQMADIGTEKLPLLLDTIQTKANQLFDSSKYKVTLTGTSISFLEGSKFIINGLKESIIWAFVLIALCMLYLFRSFRILICSLIPNIIPLIVTAGVMGWAGIPLKPSTVLIFSVALGIVVDITIRFLVNYRQEMRLTHHDSTITVRNTLHQTGLSIIYTSLVLMAGFVIFCWSGFGGTFALGWLTSLTLFVATITNLVLLPVLILTFQKKSRKAS